MNSYTENLQEAISTTLQVQYLNHKDLGSQAEAASFTLKYAREATLSTDEKLKSATAVMEFKRSVKEQAGRNKDRAANLLTLATQADQYVKQSVTNTAVSASNVQIAANAIIRLASDVGNIFSIIKAADFDSDIYKKAVEARELINDTAYAAEQASQMAMEASALIAEVSSSTVSGQTKLINAPSANLFNILSADFDTSAQIVARGTATLTAASEKEILAARNFEATNAYYKAAQHAYDMLNNELNLGLIVSNITATAFTIGFNIIKTVFDVTRSPVKNYYMVLVKASSKTIFSINSAEELFYKKDKSFVNIPVASGEKDRVNKQVEIKNIQDADGDVIKPGQQYVCFLFAVYADEHKKRLNNFDDFLSAPSQSFQIDIA